MFIVRGSGNSSVKIDYHQTDFNPAYGISFYRLKQTDCDGKFSYSEPVKLKFEPKEEFEIVSLSWTDSKKLRMVLKDSGKETCSVCILGLNGAQVFKKDMKFRKGMGKYTLAPPITNSGIYILTLNNGTDLRSKKFVSN